ncbi:hypothetical protein JOF53_005612 [Crossiella equi]|uniref:Reverse transcriptase domain-containing protein n=1 Tax=Crossiella equi TaxID=130796 RepID=A0ABS5AM20_9PSEU|nr:RNA-directed DNA polymerase [Crossiella equi]MBP2476740.1 hypothetical protein [Crossiella equi]
MNLGSAGIDLELPDVIAYADIRSQWHSLGPSLVEDFEDGRTSWPVNVEIVDLPKDRISVRPLARLETVHRLVYEALVIAAAADISKEVSKSVYSSCWWSRRQRFLSPVGRWIKMQRAALDFHVRNPDLFLATTDIASFYEHIDISILSDDIRRLGVQEWISVALRQFLEAFNGLSSAWGIPQGSDMSGLLANLYLTQFDEEIRRSGFKHFRYSDDTYIFGPDEDSLRGVLISANRTLRHRHLNIAGSKTAIVSGDAAMSKLEDKQKDAINYGLRIGLPGVEVDVRSLFDNATKDLINIRDVRFSLTKMRELRDDYAVGWILENVEEIPHAAREVVVYLDSFPRLKGYISASLIRIFSGSRVGNFPYIQQHLLIYFIRNSVRGAALVDKAWEILLDKNVETFVREMAARYLGLFGTVGSSGRLKQLFREETNNKLRRALLVACCESRQGTNEWLKVVGDSDRSLKITADYLQEGPKKIPYPQFERPPWR